MFKGDALDADIAEPAHPGSEDLLLDGQFHFVLSGIGVAGKADVDPEPVVLTPEGSVFPAESLIKFDLLETPPIDEHHAAPLEMPP
jgi:hypothetical protein